MMSNQQQIISHLDPNINMHILHTVYAYVLYLS